MPILLKSFKKGYNYGNSIKNESKKLEEMVKQNFIKKDMQNKKDEKFLEGGIKHSLKKFDQKIKKKIKDF
jgi:hypothetical protein